MANAQWIFINWGQQFSTWRKSVLAVFNWFLILGKSNKISRGKAVTDQIYSIRIFDGFWSLHIHL